MEAEPSICYTMNVAITILQASSVVIGAFVLICVSRHSLEVAALDWMSLANAQTIWVERMAAALARWQKSGSFCSQTLFENLYYCGCSLFRKHTAPTYISGKVDSAFVLAASGLTRMGVAEIKV